MTRRLDRRAAITALLGAPLVACGERHGAPPSITLALWSSSAAESAAMDHVIGRFTRASGIAVRKEVIADRYMDVLRSRFAARNPPDVFYLDAFEAPALIAADVLEPMDDVIARPQEFYPRFLDAFRGDDRRLYSIPKDFSTLALYANSALLEAAGIDASRVPADFEDLCAFAAQLQPRLRRGARAMLVETELARHLSALECADPSLIAANGDARFAASPAVHDYLQAWLSGRRDGSMASARDDLGADWAGAAFGAQKAALMIEGNWVVPALRRDFPDVRYSVRPMPTVRGRAHTMAFVVGLSVARWSKNRPGGLAFARFMTGEAMPDWSERAGLLPTRQTVTVEGGAAQAVHRAAAPHATVWSRGTGLPIIATNFAKQFQAALNGSKPLDAALRKLDEVSNREIARQHS